MGQQLMDYEWDAEKNDKARRERAGSVLRSWRSLIGLGALCFEIQQYGDEERELWIGPIGDSLYAVMIVERDPNTRIISLREATQPEIIQWREDIQNG